MFLYYLIYFVFGKIKQAAIVYAVVLFFSLVL